MTKHGYRLISGPALAIALHGCASVPPFDPGVDADAAAIETRAGTFFQALRGKAAPDCAFDANAGEYAAMKDSAASLTQRTAGDAALARSANALANAISGAERSHQLASATVTDPSGACLPADAIDLNASAITRAAASIRTLEEKRRGN